MPTDRRPRTTTPRGHSATMRPGPARQEATHSRRRPLTPSPALKAAIARESGHPDASILPYLPRAVVAEAGHLADVMARDHLAPPDPATLRVFLEDLHDTLNAVTGNPTDGDALAIRVNAACMVLATQPRVIFGKGFVTACLSRFRFLPAPAELLTVAEEQARPWHSRATQLRLITARDRARRFTLGHAPPTGPTTDPTHPPLSRQDNVQP